MDGRRARSDRSPGQAHDLFDRFLALRTDLGLLAEEYDHVTGRQWGSFPQAYSHIGVIGSALLLQQLGSGAPAAEAEVLLAAGV
ncbi:glycoside hydrolase family 15 protein [Streptomyces avermitilis]|uniref:glycoside hydrolase family 15 protein n=1 Tax=Streptomyces avermitilis TaxID=33903 RepID=UPI003F4D3AEC